MVKKIIYIFLLYCFLFSPPVAVGSVRIYFEWLLWPFALYYIIGRSAVFIFFVKKFKVEFQIMLYLVFYALLRGVAGGELSTFISNFTGLISLVAVPFFLIKYGESICKTKDDYIRYILLAGSVAAIFSVLCLSIPSLDNVVRNQIIRYRPGEVGFEAYYRGFGLGSQLTSHYSFVLGIMVAIGLFFKGYKWFYFVIPFAILACLVNARTGIVVAFLGIMLYFMFSGRIFASVLALTIGIVTWLNLEPILNTIGVSEATLRWTGVFMDEMDIMAAGSTEDTTFGFILNEMVLLPQDFSGWLVGNGFSLFKQHQEFGQFHSDIGFVNQLSFGGLLYVIPLYYLVFYVCRRFYRHDQKAFSLFIVFTFLITNFKGGFVFNTPSFALTLLIYYLVMIYYKVEESSPKKSYRLKTR